MPDRRAEWLTSCAAAVLVAGFVASAEARPGGGQSYSGSSRPSSNSGSSHSYSGSSGGSSHSYGSSSSWRSPSSGGGRTEELTWGELVVLSLVGGVVAIAAAVTAVKAINDIFADAREARRLEGLAHAQMASSATQLQVSGWSERPRGPRSRARSEGLHARDPHFSSVVFEDLAFRLYAAAYTRAWSGGDLDGLAPYLAPHVAEALRDEVARRGDRVGGVTIGRLSAGMAKIDDARTTIVVDVEANVSWTGAHEATLYLVERWTFARAAGAVTRPPEQVMSLGCPSCGSPFRSTDHRRCERCGKVVADGSFEWQVVERDVVEHRVMAPTLTRSVVEIGTDDPTIVQRTLQSRLADLAAAGPDATLDGIRARVNTIFRELNAGWDAREPGRMRPVLTDALFDSMRYWLAAYEARGLHNRVEAPAITCIEPAKVQRDHFFDAVTLRVYATCRDYTIDGEGAIVSGSRSERRAYSEYWTVIRGRKPGERRGGADQCPNCGAPLRLTMAGNCEHCDSHLTLGEFDWVLSKIEQDESYRG